MARNLPGITVKARTDLPVLLPYRIKSGQAPGLTAWLASLPPWTGLVLMMPLLIWPFASHAAGKFGMYDAFTTLTKWIPFLFTSGFLFNILISLFSMLFGTVAGVVPRAGANLDLLACAPDILVSDSVVP